MKSPSRRPSSVLIPLVVSLAIVAASGSVSRAGEASWPQEFKVDDSRIVFYEPQFETLDQELLKGRAAVAITPKGRTTPILGAAWIESEVAIDRDARTVQAKATKIARVHVPDFTPEEEARLQKQMSRVVSDLNLTMSLDRLTAGLNASRNERRAALDLKMTPPRILFETSAAFLAVLDGPPKGIRVKGTPLERIVNTPSFMVRDTRTGRHYLQGAGRWYEAGEIRGPWKTIDEPPDAVATLWEKGGDEETTRGERAAAASAGEGAAPRVVVATEPTELIVSDGKPEFAPIAGLDLLYMSNTSSDVLMEVGSQDYYVLLSGRWFRSASLEGPWEHVRPDMLPESFAKIPPGSVKGDLLASVAGTPQAEEAVLDSAVPQTAVIRKSDAKLTVTYDGEPEFRPIPKTGVEYAVNTNAQVMKIDGRYYAVDQGVWFESDSPNGPWEVADEAPPEVQQLPPDAPVYNTKYVYVYDSNPDRVYVGYLPGYLGYYPYDGTVVYGTGWYYPGWWGSVYYPYPWTWGFGVHYSSWAGWSFGFGIGFGYGWYPYSPWYAWGYPGWWGPIGWGPCYAHYYPPYYAGVPPGAVVPARPPRGSNTNLYRLPENATRVAQTRDKYASRTAASSRGQGRLVGRSDPARGAGPSTPAARGAAANRPTTPTTRGAAASRPTTPGRAARQPGSVAQAPGQAGRPRSAAAPPATITRPGVRSARPLTPKPPVTPGRTMPSVRSSPPGRSAPRSVRAPSNQGAPAAGRSRAAPSRSGPPSVRSAPSVPRSYVPSFGGGGRSVGGGGRSFGGARSYGGGGSMGHAGRGSGGGGMGAPRGGGHRR